MTMAVARQVMSWAADLLRRDRPAWAAAMLGEFEEAAAHGAALPFALGCLAAAWRELPFHAAGRLRLTSYALALGVVVPIGLVNLSCSLPGWRMLIDGTDHYYAKLAAGGMHEQALAESYKAATPLLVLCIMLLGLLHLLIAAAMLKRHFRRAAMLWSANAAVASVLFVVSLWLFPPDPGRAPTIFAGPIVELVCVPALMWWQARLWVRRGEP